MSSSNITNIVEFVKPQKETFLDYLPQFTTYLTSRRLSKRVIAEYPQIIKTAWSYFDELGIQSIYDITLLDLEEWTVEISGREWRGNNISQNTVLKYCQVVKLMLKYLYKHGILKRKLDEHGDVYESELYNLWEHPKRVKRLPMPTPDESTVRQVLNTFDETDPIQLRDKLICLLGYEGCRSAEITGLTRADIRNYRNGRIKFIGKGDVQANVYLTDYTVKLLKIYMENYRDDFVKGKYKRGGRKTNKPTAESLDLVFCSKNGYHLTGQNVLDMFRKATTSIGLDYKEYRFHSLRSAMITSLYANGKGASLVSIQRIARHRSLNTTLGYIYSDSESHSQIHRQYHPLSQNYKGGVAC